MPTLTMHLGKILLDKCQLDYDGCETVVDRILYQQRMCSYLYWLHYDELCWRIKLEPAFYIDEESKMNDRNFKITKEQK